MDKANQPKGSKTIKRSNKQKKEFNMYRKKRINEIKKDALFDYNRLRAMNGGKNTHGDLTATINKHNEMNRSLGVLNNFVLTRSHMYTMISKMKKAFVFDGIESMVSNQVLPPPVEDNNSFTLGDLSSLTPEDTHRDRNENIVVEVVYTDAEKPPIQHNPGGRKVGSTDQKKWQDKINLKNAITKVATLYFNKKKEYNQE